MRKYEDVKLIIPGEPPSQLPKMSQFLSSPFPASLLSLSTHFSQNDYSLWFSYSFLLCKTSGLSPSFACNPRPHTPFTLVSLSLQHCLWIIPYIMAMVNIRRNRKVKSKSKNGYGNMGIWVCGCAWRFSVHDFCFFSSVSSIIAKFWGLLSQ